MKTIRKQIDKNTFLISSFNEKDFTKGVVFYDIYDDETNKTLHIKAHSLEEAEGIAETLDWDSEADGNRIDVLDEIANYEAMEEYKKIIKQ